MAKISPTCIKCGDSDACVIVRLDGEDDSGFKCEGCDADFTCGDVREFFAQWEKVLKWVEAMPDA